MKELKWILLIVSLLSGCAGITSSEILRPSTKINGKVVSEDPNLSISDLDVAINFYVPVFPMSEKTTISTVKTDKDGRFTFLVPFKGYYQLEIGESGHNKVWGFEYLETKSGISEVIIEIKRQNWKSNKSQKSSL